MEVRVEKRPLDVVRECSPIDRPNALLQRILPDFLSIEDSFLQRLDPVDDAGGDLHVRRSSFSSWAGSDRRLRVYPKGRGAVRGWVSAEADPYAAEASRPDDGAAHPIEHFLGLQEMQRLRFVDADHFSDAVRWVIPDFCTDEDCVLRSPAFPLAGCSWQLSACTERSGHLSVYVRREETADDGVEIGFHVGLMRANLSVEELRSGTTGEFVVEGPEFSWGWSEFMSLEELRRRESELLMPWGNLTVSIRVRRGGTPAGLPKRLFGEHFTEDRRTTPQSGPEVPFPDHRDGTGGDGRYDVTIDVQGRRFRAHRSVLSAGSRVFRATFEHDTVEARTGVLSIPDCDPGTFGEFLRFLYTGKMREVSRTSALSIYATSDKYDVQRLKKFCADYLAQTLTTENFCAVVALADRHSDERLTTAARHFFDRNHREIVRTSAWSTLCEDLFFVL